MGKQKNERVGDATDMEHDTEDEDAIDREEGPGGDATDTEEDPGDPYTSAKSDTSIYMKGEEQ